MIAKHFTFPQFCADLQARLTPGGLHPARLTGLHIWHPWDLTTRRLSDHRIRLAATTGFASDIPDRPS
ncbi:MAG: hypothetical protein ACQEUI_10440 [Actinomycetota bacterium]